MLRTTAVLLFAFVCSGVVAEELSEEKLQKIAAIDYQGIGFSSNQQDLLKTLPGNDLVSSGKGVSTYEIRDDASNDCVLLRFADDELVEIDFIYFPSRVNSMGGEEILTTRALEKFGTPTRREDKTLLWDFPSIDRIVVSSYEDEKWSLHIYHRTRRLKIPGYKDASATPKASRIQITIGPMVPTGYVSRRHKNAPRFVIETINMEAITSNAKHDHPNDYSTQYFVINNQVRAYEELSNFSRPRDMPTGDYANLRNSIAKDHPADYSTQAFVLKNQLQAYQELKNYRCPQDMPTRTFKFLKGKIVRDHPSDYSTQIYVLKSQLSAYSEIANMSTPEGMAGSHFFRLRESAVRKHRQDYSTQLYVLKGYINEYLLYRESKNGGDAILRYLLRFD